MALPAQGFAVGSLRSTVELIDSTADSFLGTAFSSVSGMIPGATGLTTAQGGVTDTQATVIPILTIHTLPHITITALQHRLRL